MQDGFGEVPKLLNKATNRQTMVLLLCRVPLHFLHFGVRQLTPQVKLVIVKPCLSVRRLCDGGLIVPRAVERTPDVRGQLIEGVQKQRLFAEHLGKSVVHVALDFALVERHPVRRVDCPRQIQFRPRQKACDGAPVILVLLRALGRLAHCFIQACPHSQLGREDQLSIEQLSEVQGGLQYEAHVVEPQVGIPCDNKKLLRTSLVRCFGSAGRHLGGWRCSFCHFVVRVPWRSRFAWANICAGNTNTGKLGGPAQNWPKGLLLLEEFVEMAPHLLDITKHWLGDGRLELPCHRVLQVTRVDPEEFPKRRSKHRWILQHLVVRQNVRLAARHRSQAIVDHGQSFLNRPGLELVVLVRKLLHVESPNRRHHRGNRVAHHSQDPQIKENAVELSKVHQIWVGEAAAAKPFGVSATMDAN
eukprot:m.41342 g.41342  ORF g.41342 m.41342 type:complete len:415 (+) comp8200_c0_seq2:702-1946(+)